MAGLHARNSGYVKAQPWVGFVVRLSGINLGREPDLPGVQMVRAKLLTSPPCPLNSLESEGICHLLPLCILYPWIR